MEERNRRKSKITLINNDFRDEEPIYISGSDEMRRNTNTELKSKKILTYEKITSNESIPGEEKMQKCPKTETKPRPKQVYTVITSSEFDSEDQKQKNQEMEIKLVSKTLDESSDKCVDLNKVGTELLNPIVVLKKLTREDQEKSFTEFEDSISKSKPPRRRDKTLNHYESQKLFENLSKEHTPIKDSIKKNEIVEQTTPNITSRRSGRTIKLSMKALEAAQYRTPSKIPTSSSSESEFEMDDNIEKPTALFESKDVEGKEMYGFHTPKKRTALLQKAKSVVNSPMSSLQEETAKISLTPRTPKSTTKKYEAIKTPAAVRNKVRKELEHVVRELEDEDFSDFSPSESDYLPSDSSSSSSVSSDTEQEIVPEAPKQVRSVRPTRKTQKEIMYSLQSDDYFSTQNTKAFTSDNTLDKLKNPRLTQDKINDILQNVKINREHAIKITELLKEYETNFEKWLCLMYEGNFSILLYGLGSKRTILEHFRLYLQNEKCPVIFINGFFPSLVIKDVIDAIANDLLRLKEVSSNTLEMIHEIGQFLINNDEIHIFLIVCNIDGEMLRSSKTQNILSKLVSIKNIHLIASIDDINAPLIWDHKKLNRFNFTWWDTTTFLPYVEETSFEGSLLVQKSGTLTLSSLKNIFQSLTTNARGIFNIIIKHHLDNKKDAHYQGISFKDLYSSCREAFLVSSDIALRAQLTEFLDHKLIKSKRNLDGAELLHIPIEGSLLQHFLDHE